MENKPGRCGMVGENLLGVKVKSLLFAALLLLVSVATINAQTQATAVLDVLATPADGGMLYVGFPSNVVAFEFVSGSGAGDCGIAIRTDDVSLGELKDRIVLIVGAHSEVIGAAAFVRRSDHKLLLIANEAGEAGNDLVLGADSLQLVVEGFSGGGD